MKITLEVYSHLAIQFLDGRRLDVATLPEYGDPFDVRSLLTEAERQLEMDEINIHCKYTDYAGMTVEEFFDEAEVTVDGVYRHPGEKELYVVELKMHSAYSETGD